MRKTATFLIFAAVFFYFRQLKENVSRFSDTLSASFSSHSSNEASPNAIRQLAQATYVGVENHTAQEIANDIVRSKKEEWKLQPHHEMRTQEISTPLGTRVTYTFFQDNLPLLDQNIQIVVSKRGKVLSVENNYLPLEKADIASADFSDVSTRLKEKFDITDIDKNHDPVLFPIPGLNKPTLAFPITIKNDKGPEMEILVRATDGEILSKTPARKEF